MNCRNCHNDRAYRLTIRTDGIEVCDRCGDVGAFYVPDLFVDGKPEHNLPDDPATGKPPVFHSRMEKERFLRQHHLVEVRGSEHGGPPLPKSSPAYDPIESRHETMLALKHVQEMGSDRRRQEYRRILQEAQNAR